MVLKTRLDRWIRPIVGWSIGLERSWIGGPTDEPIKLVNWTRKKLNWRSNRWTYQIGRFNYYYYFLQYQNHVSIPQTISLGVAHCCRVATRWTSLPGQHPVIAKHPHPTSLAVLWSPPPLHLGNTNSKFLPLPHPTC